MSASYILSEALDFMHCITDLDGQIVKSNELFKEYTSHIKPSKISDIIADNDDLDRYLEQVNKANESSPKPVRLFTLIRQKTGVNHYTLWNIYVILGSINFLGTQVPDFSSKAAIQNYNSDKLLEHCLFSINHDVINNVVTAEGLIKLAIDDHPEYDILKMIAECNAKEKIALLSLVKKLAREL
jgi:hypothetical protein